MADQGGATSASLSLLVLLTSTPSDACGIPLRQPWLCLCLWPWPFDGLCRVMCCVALPLDAAVGCRSAHVCLPRSMQGAADCVLMRKHEPRAEETEREEGGFWSRSPAFERLDSRRPRLLIGIAGLLSLLSSVFQAQGGGWAQTLESCLEKQTMGPTQTRPNETWTATTTTTCLVCLRLRQDTTQQPTLTNLVSTCEAVSSEIRFCRCLLLLLLPFPSPTSLHS